MPAASNDHRSAVPSAPLILVADDQPDVALVLGKLLEAFGYRVVSCHSASEALAVLERQGDVALVLSDIRMPGGDGFDLVRALRERFPALPVLLMSGMADRGDKGPHGVAVLPKPIDPATLERVVKEVLATPA